MASIDEQIRANNAKIDANNAAILRLETNAASTKADADDDKIRSQKKYKDKDEANRQRKWDLAAAELNQATVLRSMNETLMNDNKALIKQREAESQSMIILANQGTTTAAVQTKATAEAESAKIIAQSNAQAIATKASTEASNSTTDSKTKMMITVVVVVVVLAVLGTIAYKKFKKAKK